MDDMICRRLKLLCVSVALIILCIVNHVHAQDTLVEIELDPDVRTIRVGVGPQEIALVARSAQQNLSFEWKLHGLGELLGDAGSPGIFYVPPVKIDGESAQQATIILNIHDDGGNTSSYKVIFTLLGSSELSSSSSLLKIKTFALENFDGNIGPQDKLGCFLLEPGTRMQVVSTFEGETSDKAWKLRYQAIRGSIDRNGIYTAPDKNGIRDMITIRISGDDGMEYTLPSPVLKLKVSNEVD